MAERFITPLISAGLSGIDWVASLIPAPPTQEDDFRFISCIMSLGLSNGKDVSNKAPLLFFDTETKRSAFGKLSEVTWLQGSIQAPVQVSSQQTPDQVTFQALWDSLLTCKRILDSEKDLFRRPAYAYMNSAPVQAILSNFYEGSHWRKAFSVPIGCILPELGSCLYYQGQIWGLETGTSIELGRKYLTALSDGTGTLEPYALDPKFQEEWKRLQNVASQERQGTENHRRPLPEAVRHEVWRRDQGRCVRCGSREKLEFDHIVPFTRGGSDTARNIELLCEPCNRRKSARI